MIRPMHHIEGYPIDTLIREDDHVAKKSTYLQVKGVDFISDEYDHGTKELKKKYNITK